MQKRLKQENVCDRADHMQGENLLLTALFRKHTHSEHSPYCAHEHLASCLLSISSFHQGQVTEGNYYYNAGKRKAKFHDTVIEKMIKNMEISNKPMSIIDINGPIDMTLILNEAELVLTG